HLSYAPSDFYKPHPKNPDREFQKIKPRWTLTTHKPDRLFPPSNSDRPFITHKTRSPKSPHQTAIAPHHP
ncbi:MAG: hypothetical protein ACK466_11580, partial [Pseudanabaena sp.]